MLDIGWSEMAMILMVALIVIGPKDLPRLARTVGQWTQKARSMAREFHRSLDDMAREAELQDIKAELEKVRRADIGTQIRDTIDPDREMRDALEPPRLDADRPPPPAASRPGEERVGAAPERVVTPEPADAAEKR